MYGRRAGGAPALWRRVRWANVGRLAALLAAGALILLSVKPSGPGEPAFMPAPVEPLPRERPPHPPREPSPRPRPRPRPQSPPRRPPRPKQRLERRRKPAQQRTEPPAHAGPAQPQAPKPPAPPAPAPLSPAPVKPTPGEFTPDPA